MKTLNPDFGSLLCHCSWKPPPSPVLALSLSLPSWKQTRDSNISILEGKYRKILVKATYILSTLGNINMSSSQPDLYCSLNSLGKKEGRKGKNTPKYHIPCTAQPSHGPSTPPPASLTCSCTQPANQSSCLWEGRPDHREEEHLTTHCSRTWHCTHVQQQQHCYHNPPQLQASSTSPRCLKCPSSS